MPRRIYLTSNLAQDLEADRLKDELEKATGLKYPGLSLRDLIVVDGNPDGSSLEACKRALYSEYCENADSEDAQSGCSVTLICRPGRSDARSDAIKAILSLNPYNSGISIRTGKQYLFEAPLTKEEYDAALVFFLDPLTEIPAGIKESTQSQSSTESVAVGFNLATYRELAEFKEKHNLKIDIDDMMCIQNQFLSESRDPTYAEIAVIDRFFGEDFRHTTFETLLDKVKISDHLTHSAWDKYQKKTKHKKPSLAGIAEASKNHAAEETTQNIDNRIRGIKVNTDSGDYLVSFVGESKNRSVSAQPYDGASGCLSEIEKNALCRLGSISDTYRISGISDDPEALKPADYASDGFNDYASAVGIPCSKTTRLISSSYREKQLEFCAALSVSKLDALDLLYERKANPDDTVYLLGARTGRDGSVCFEESGSAGEFVAVTNPGIMNALSRFILREDAQELIQAIAYVGSGGIVCAIGKIARGAVIHTEKIPAKFNGISAEELLLSESSERMIVCVSEKDSKHFKDICHEENLPFAEIAEITDDDRIIATSAKSLREVSIKTEFLLSGGTVKHRGASVEATNPLPKSVPYSFAYAPYANVGRLKKMFSKKLRPDLKSAFTEACKYIRFTADNGISRNDSTVGNGWLTSPLSDKTPSSAVRGLTYNGELLTQNGTPLCSVIALGSNPAISRSNPFKGAYLAVTEALTNAVTSGFGDAKLHIAIQEYLPEYNDSSKQYGLALSSLLGAYEAQLAFDVPSLGGKSAHGRVGSKKENNVGIAAFAIGIAKSKKVVTRDFKNPGNAVVIFKPELSQDSLPEVNSQMEVFRSYNALVKDGKILSAVAVNARSAASGIIEMCHSSGLGFTFSADRSLEAVFDNCYGSIIAELAPGTSIPHGSHYLGRVGEANTLMYLKKSFEINRLFELANINPYSYPVRKAHKSDEENEQLEHPLMWKHLPNDNYGNDRTHSLEGIRVLIPVNNYYTVSVSDIREKFKLAGCMVDVISYNEATPAHLIRGLERADIIYMPDCMGHPAFANTFFKLTEIQNAVALFRQKGGLIYGEGNGFEVLLASGLLDIDQSRLGVCKNPNGKTVFEIGRIRALSLYSPLMRKCKLGELYDTVITGKRLRLCAEPEYIQELASEGRIASQFISSDNFTQCTEGVEAICSRDGRILGRLSHTTRLDGAEEFHAMPTIRSIIEYFKENKH